MVRVVRRAAPIERRGWQDCRSKRGSVATDPAAAKGSASVLWSSFLPLVLVVALALLKTADAWPCLWPQNGRRVLRCRRNAMAVAGPDQRRGSRSRAVINRTRVMRR